MQRLYVYREPPSDAQVDRVTDGWRPYRMWCSVLVRSAERRARTQRSALPAHQSS